MLVIRRILDRVRLRDDDRGAVLVAVVVVMFVGFIAAATVAASVLFTIQANSRNTSSTQAFIAAESGRDQAAASLASAIDSNGDLHCTSAMLTGAGSAPDFTYVIRSTQSETRPSKGTDAGVDDVCPTVATTFVVITAIGSDDRGGTATVDAVYPWRLTHVEQPAGTMAYFDGEFKATKTTYSGDLVIRGTDPYTCNNASTIDGDLWVVKSNVELSTDCHITGSIYAYGTVVSSSQDVTVGGDIIAGGNIDLVSNGAVVGGSIHSGAAVFLRGIGAVDGTVGGTVTGGTAPNIDPKWTDEAGDPLVGITGSAPVFAPTLEDVFEVTKWLELTSSGTWGSAASTPATVIYTTCDAATIRTEMARSDAGRALFDLSACLDPSKKRVDVTLSGTAYTLARDVVFYIPGNKKMSLDVSANINATGDPQLLFIHADSNGADAAPTACAEGMDSLAISGVVQPRMMIYSPCGLNGNITASFRGQLYTANSGSHLVLAEFTCAPMGWLPAFGNLSCGIKGEGGALDTSKDVVSLDPLDYQSER